MVKEDEQIQIVRYVRKGNYLELHKILVELMEETGQNLLKCQALSIPSVCRNPEKWNNAVMVLHYMKRKKENIKN